MTEKLKPKFEVPLTKGAVAIIDAIDVAEISKHKWHLCNGYAKRSVRISPTKTISIPMHRQILSAPDGLSVDHIDGDRLNNSRANLRLCTTAENNYNRPKQRSKGSRPFKGVRRRGNRWIAEIGVNGVQNHIGSFMTAEDAAHAYNVAAKERFGEFANLNEVKPGCPSPKQAWAEIESIRGECGLSPRELLEGYRELRKALTWMTQRADEGGYPDGRCLQEARTALAKHKEV